VDVHPASAGRLVPRARRCSTRLRHRRPRLSSRTRSPAFGERRWGICFSFLRVIRASCALFAPRSFLPGRPGCFYGMRFLHSGWACGTERTRPTSSLGEHDGTCPGPGVVPPSPKIDRGFSPWRTHSDRLLPPMFRRSTF